MSKEIQFPLAIETSLLDILRFDFFFPFSPFPFSLLTRPAYRFPDTPSV
jgi:hypothetical protein